MGALTFDLDTRNNAWRSAWNISCVGHEDGNDFLFRIVTGMKRGPPFHARIEGRIYGGNIRVITCPKEFKTTLQVKCSSQFLGRP
ncbi:hypothetical protein TNCT_116841 [Trichonephila clavata]|uniref:Uncharacterized protein n=1 Tax=Trichonephila clavata TaxID=2740835 RepID=A0A8X6LYF7_TRICU|nr:hypothetical protein TNCT_116841 [Trichonephila clavata]